MGGAVSAGEDNDELVDNLVDSEYIKSGQVEAVMRAVDRANYYVGHVDGAYRDMAWRHGNLHLSAPCIYSEVMEALDLRPGMSFLNLGSGTGYLSTMVGLIIGPTGINHGVEFYPDVIDYAHKKLHEFKAESSALIRFGFCEPIFVTGNCLCIDAATDKSAAGGQPTRKYDRIYCGASVASEFEPFLSSLLKIGGVLVMPVGDTLVQITRREPEKFDRKNLLAVSFATLLEPMPTDPPVRLPELRPHSLRHLATLSIQDQLRRCIHRQCPQLLAPANAKERRASRRRSRRSAKRKAVRLAHYVKLKNVGGGGDGAAMNPIDELADRLSDTDDDDEIMSTDSDDDGAEGDAISSDEADPMARPLRRLQVKIQRTATALHRLVNSAATGMVEMVDPSSRVYPEPIAPPASVPIGSSSGSGSSSSNESPKNSNLTMNVTGTSDSGSDPNSSPTPSGSSPDDDRRRPSTSSVGSNSKAPEIAIEEPSPAPMDEATDSGSSDSNDEDHGDDQEQPSGRNKRSISLQSDGEINLSMVRHPGGGPVSYTLNRLRSGAVLKRRPLSRRLARPLEDDAEDGHESDHSNQSDPDEYKDCLDQFPRPEDPFVEEMKRRIRLLPLPTTLKILVNCNRELD